MPQHFPQSRVPRDRFATRRNTNLRRAVEALTYRECPSNVLLQINHSISIPSNPAQQSAPEHKTAGRPPSGTRCGCWTLGRATTAAIPLLCPHPHLPRKGCNAFRISAGLTACRGALSRVFAGGSTRRPLLRGGDRALVRLLLYRGATRSKAPLECPARD